jgi:hypothetical protein
MIKAINRNKITSLWITMKMIMNYQIKKWKILETTVYFFRKNAKIRTTKYAHYKMI